MREVSHFVGLDVHKDTISIAVAEAGRAQARDLGSIPNELAKLRRKLDRLGPRRLICCCYEAGPTGYGLYRHLIVEGYACSVVAPSKIPLKLGGSGSHIAQSSSRPDAGAVSGMKQLHRLFPSIAQRKGPQL